jgi:hypothetical protein
MLMIFNVCIYINYLVRGAWKTTITICECVNEMWHIVANTTLNLCHGGLQEVEKVKCIEVTLTKDMIAYRGSVRDAGPSTRWNDIAHSHTCMGITDLFLSWTSWGDTPDPSMSALGPSMSAPDPFMS